MERNRKLAEALDIDTTSSFHEPENIKGGYQLRTLEYFVNNRSWCLEIEGMFRDFLGGTTMRLAFKPMTGHKREFMHELAEAYGLDSDSIDHEPYRRYFIHVPVDCSVEIYRNNRTAVPRYTLSEAAKLKNPHSMSAATYASSGLVQMRKYTPGVAYNAIFLDGVKGTVLQADLQMALNPILRPSKLVFSLKVWLSSCQADNSGRTMVKTFSFCLGQQRFPSKTSKVRCTAS
jgi:transcriptional repressor NF-X1